MIYFTKKTINQVFITKNTKQNKSYHVAINTNSLPHAVQMAAPLTNLQKDRQATRNDKVRDCFSWVYSKLPLSQELAFPFRYLGSKTWSLPGVLCRLPLVTIKHLFTKNVSNSFSEDLFGMGDQGYHRFGHQTLTPDAVKPFMKYGGMNAAIQSGLIGDPFVTPFGYQNVSSKSIMKQLKQIPIAMEAHDTCFFDPKTGLKVAIYEKNDHIIIAYGSLTGAESEIKDKVEQGRLKRILLTTARANIVGIKAALYKDAEVMCKEIIDVPQFKNKRITVTGHSLGGTIASFVSLKCKLEGVALNALPLGVGLQEEIGQSTLINADKYLTHIIAKTDPKADLPVVVGGIDAIVNFVGLKTPGNFGRKYLVPSAYSSGFETHAFILGSMMQHSGFDKRTYPKDLVHDPKAKRMFE